ncbi:MAG: hypothetical protein HY690_13345 [Chloroflexi bacterium]|nr:hypothetical protein [Chloroflexota bacterium]
MAGSLATAATAFEATLQELGFSGVEGELGDPVALGRRAALLVAAEAAWRRHLGPLLDTRQVQELLGVRTRQAVNDLAKRRRLLALPTQKRRLRFPAFQFTGEGRPYPVLPAILDTFAGAVASPHTIASWFVTPQPLLEGETPARWLQQGRDPEAVKEAARRSAARLRQ